MKKRFALFVIFVGTFILVYSQGYINTIDTTSFYNYYRISSGPSPSHNVCYKFGNDTTIGSNNCTEVLCSLDTITWYSSGAFLYEDSINERVYLIANDTIGLIYDYSAEEGDTVFVYNPLYSLNTIPLVVNTVDSIYFDGDFHKTMSFDFYHWIEGVGDIKIGLLYPGHEVVASFVESLVCYYKNDNLAYNNPIYASCFFSTDVIYSSNTSFECYFSNSMLYYKSNSQITSISIYNQLGQIVFIKPINNVSGCIKVPVTLYGLYFFEFNFITNHSIIKKYHL